MAKQELGTKRVDPETGRKFYDLNKDPIVSPYTGKSYPLSFFETVKASRSRVQQEEETEEQEVTEVAETDEETVSINDVEDEEGGATAPKNDLPNVDGDEDDDVVDDDSDDDDDTFLADDEDEDDDMTDIIGGGRDDEDDV
ncbi:hypothetical protein NS365_03295 [Aureimonas ureilytica]|uniref:TIGR02300 family protein n=2 Tax=Aureimonas ureilytica TaxID=401562 RepID=A0A175RXB0_9HYPH|nr:MULTISPECIES: TIGR02300 family protein [Aureimonas]KTR07604.1 hypothetical protein NS365_03295 [Aureimonas ureilytica]